MLSESARMSSAAEAAFRVQAPNSLPRSIKVIALDAPAELVVKRLADAPWSQATFLTTVRRRGVSQRDHAAWLDGGLTDLAGRPRSLADEVSSADLVVMVAGPGGLAESASRVGEVCRLERVMATALVIDAAASSEEALSKTLAQVRPWSLMVVIADADDYVDETLIALRA
jgi:hypothetical protein